MGVVLSRQVCGHLLWLRRNECQPQDAASGFLWVIGQWSFLLLLFLSFLFNFFFLLFLVFDFLNFPSLLQKTCITFILREKNPLQADETEWPLPNQGEGSEHRPGVLERQ